MIVTSCSRVAEEVGLCGTIRARRESVLGGFVTPLAGILRFNAAADGLASFADAGHISQLPRTISRPDHRLVESRQVAHAAFTVKRDVVGIAKKAPLSVGAAGNERVVLVYKRVVS